MEFSKLVSSIYNDIVGGLSGYNANPAISMEQLEDEVVEMRQAVVKDFYLKNLLNKDDLAIALNCVSVDCADPAKCCSPSGKTQLHFEIPQLMDDIGEDAIKFVGSVDREVSYDVVFDKNQVKSRKYRRRGGDVPYVYIEKTPNENGFYDGWIYNLPFVKRIAVIGIFKDLRQLQELTCDCQSFDDLDFGAISTEIKDRLVKKKLQYYRQNIQQPQPNNLTPR